MDDHFLHQLRREPPAGFAIRLKWQLDRPPPPRPARARLLLVFAIFGTAFALVSPPGRRLVGDLFHTTAGDTQAPTAVSGLRQAPPAASTGVAGGAAGPPRSMPPRAASAAPEAPGSQSRPLERPDDLQPVRPEVQPFVGAARGADSVSVQSPAVQTPQLRAEATIETRQALFKLLGLVTRPLGSMLAGQTPLDMQLARTSAYRLNELSTMIPEVFHTDTRASDARTRTLAIDLVWTQPADFDSKAGALTVAAAALKGAIAEHDRAATLKAIGRVQMACQACHDTYRMNP